MGHFLQETRGDGDYLFLGLILPLRGAIGNGAVDFEDSILLGDDVISVLRFDAQFRGFSQFDHEALPRVRIHRDRAVFADIPILVISS